MSIDGLDRLCRDPSLHREGEPIDVAIHECHFAACNAGKQRSAEPDGTCTNHERAVACAQPCTCDGVRADRQEFYACRLINVSEPAG